jgi:hypothetical protein
LHIKLKRSLPKDTEEFADLCSKHNVMDLYIWLSFRYPKHFIERDQCIEQKQYALKQIEETLSTSNLKHEYSYEDAYLSLRKKKSEIFNNPNSKIPENIMSLTRENLKHISADKLFIFPNLPVNRTKQNTENALKRNRKPQNPKYSYTINSNNKETTAYLQKAKDIL